MQFGEVKIADDGDFTQFKSVCLSQENWRQVYSKNGTVVSMKPTDVSDFDMVKVEGEYPDVSADVLYDVLQDGVYRKTWDPKVIDSYEICQVNFNSDIGYYSVKLVPPLMDRDFVMQRSWLDLGNEKIIFNHSVNHLAVPVQKNIVRAISYLTGYYVLSTGKSSNHPGCKIIFVSQTDPKGKLPSWAVNIATGLVAPKVVKKLRKASINYEAWKSKHDPQLKPWRFPEQSAVVRLNPSDILSMDETSRAELIDETNVDQEEQKNGKS